jgi:hypothetical protein
MDICGINLLVIVLFVKFQRYFSCHHYVLIDMLIAKVMFKGKQALYVQTVTPKIYFLILTSELWN